LTIPELAIPELAIPELANDRECGGKFKSQNMQFSSNYIIHVLILIIDYCPNFCYFVAIRLRNIPLKVEGAMTTYLAIVL
jgi:hypothetical protein